jgi:uncharacterized membrane protein
MKPIVSMKPDLASFYEPDTLPIESVPPLADSATKDSQCTLVEVPLETTNDAENCSVPSVSRTSVSGWLSLLILWLRVAVVLCLLSAIITRNSYPIAALNLAFAGLAASAAHFLAIKNGKGVLLAKLYLVTRVIPVLFEFAHLSEADVLRTSIGCGISLLWYLYLLRSKQVSSVYFPALQSSQASGWLPIRNRRLRIC